METEEDTEPEIELSLADLIIARNFARDNTELRNSLTEIVVRLIISQVGTQFSTSESMIRLFTEASADELRIIMKTVLTDVLSEMQPKFNYPMPWSSIAKAMATIFAVAKREGVGYKDLFEHPYRVITNYQPETNGISIHFVIPNRDPPPLTPPYASVKMELEELTKGDVCAICLEKAENKGVKCKTCGGEFHEGCVRKQLQEGCSLCRGILL